MWPFGHLAEALEYEGSSPDLDGIRAGLIRYSELLARDGLSVKPFRSEDLPILSRCTPEQRKVAASLVQVAITAHDYSVGSDSLLRTKHFVWRAIQQLGLTPKADLMDILEPDHVVEIYSRDQRQLYRNLRFFDLTPLSLEEVVGFDWTSATERDVKLTARAIAISAKMMLGLIRETIPLQKAFPTHQARWKNRGDVPNLEVSLLYGSPLFKKGQVVAFVLVHRCRMLPRLSADGL